MKMTELLKTYRNTIAKVALVSWAVIAPVSFASAASESATEPADEDRAPACTADFACSGDDVCAAASAWGVKLSFRR